MKYTEEQQLIISSNEENIKVIAVAGSGKTTTLLGYAQDKADKTKLFLAYNNDINREITHKIAKNRIENTSAVTTHGLAYREIGKFYEATLGGSLDTESYIKQFNLFNAKSDLKLALKRLVILKYLFGHYCLSAYPNIEEFIEGYLDLNPNPDSAIEKAVTVEAKYYIEKLYAYWDAVDTKRIPCIHDFYLKKYQLSKPVLKYDIILLDEAQDSTPVVIDIVMSQKATKILVGDNFQAIYGWRLAKDALSMVDFKTYYLTNSFRFHQGIADRAMESLELHGHLDRKFSLPFEIHGKGEKPENKEYKDHMVISRSNTGIIKHISETIDEIRSENNGTFPRYMKIYINGLASESDLYSYFETDEKYHCHDIYNLFAGKIKSIRNPELAKFKSINDLKERAELTDNKKLLTFINLILRLKNNYFAIFNDIKDNITYDESKAKFKYTTAHKSKGLEWDSVYLMNNFITEEAIDTWKKFIEWEKAGFPDLHILFNQLSVEVADKLYYLRSTGVPSLEAVKQEINLLYVAITRAKKVLEFEEDFMENVF